MLNQLHDLEKALRKQIISAHAAYQQILEFKNSRHPMRLALPLFRAGTIEEPYSPAPYASITDGVAVSYNESEDFKVIVSFKSTSESQIDQNGRLEIAVIGDGVPDWLAIELAIDHQFLRSTRRCTVIADVLCEVSDELTLEDAYFDLFYWDLTGTRYSAIKGTAPFKVTSQQTYVRCDFQVALTGEPAIDPARPASLALFLPKQIKRFEIADLFIEFAA